MSAATNPEATSLIANAADADARSKRVGSEITGARVC
jgi:hypothetical protein